MRTSHGTPAEPASGAVWILPLLLLSLSLTACEPEEGAGSSGSGGSTVGVAMPQSIQPQTLPVTGTLSATISSPCLNNGAPVALQDDGSGNFTGSFGNVQTGSCVFTIVFSFDDPDFGLVELVTASRTINVGGGTTNLNFGQGDYAKTDTDNDGMANLDELDIAVRSSPFIAAIPIAQLGNSITLTGSIDAADAEWLRPSDRCLDEGDPTTRFFDLFTIVNNTGVPQPLAIHAFWTGLTADGYLHVYKEPFEPADPLSASCLGGNDDFNGVFESEVARVSIDVGERLVIVASTFSNGQLVDSYTIDVASVTCDPATEAEHNGDCYYLDGSAGVCAPVYTLAPQSILNDIAASFVGRTYHATISNNCCITHADQAAEGQDWGMNAECNMAGPFTVGPELGGAGCTDVNNNELQQLTLCQTKP